MKQISFFSVAAIAISVAMVTAYISKSQYEFLTLGRGSVDAQKPSHSTVIESTPQLAHSSPNVSERITTALTSSGEALRAFIADATGIVLMQRAVVAANNGYDEDIARMLENRLIAGSESDSTAFSIADYLTVNKPNDTAYLVWLATALATNLQRQNPYKHSADISDAAHDSIVTKLVDSGEFNSAILLAERLLLDHPQSVRLLTTLASAEAASNDFTGAIQTLERIVDRDDFVSAQLAMYLYRNGEVDQAIRLANEVRQRSPMAAAGIQQIPLTKT